MIERTSALHKQREIYHQIYDHKMEAMGDTLFASIIYIYIICDTILQDRISIHLAIPASSTIWTANLTGSFCETIQKFEWNKWSDIYQRQCIHDQQGIIYTKHNNIWIKPSNLAAMIKVNDKQWRSVHDTSLYNGWDWHIITALAICLPL